MEQDTKAGARLPILAASAGVVLAVSVLSNARSVWPTAVVMAALVAASIYRKERPQWIAYLFALLTVLAVATAYRFVLFDSTAPVSAPPSAPSLYANATWNYISSADSMRGTTTRMAELYSATNLELPSPYEGPSNAAHLLITKEPGFMLIVDQGQFVCEADATVAVKVDNGPIYDYPCVLSPGGESNYLFITNVVPTPPNQPSDPKELLRKGRVLTIEPSFYGAGSRQLQFKVAGFDEKRVNDQVAE